jgi:hypothetical protein
VLGLVLGPAVLRMHGRPPVLVLRGWHIILVGNLSWVLHGRDARWRHLLPRRRARRRVERIAIASRVHRRRGSAGLSGQRVREGSRRRLCIVSRSAVHVLRWVGRLLTQGVSVEVFADHNTGLQSEGVPAVCACFHRGVDGRPLHVR